jgi:sigma-B regulation protein RsbU (phosphoserine phosphatase)
VLARLGCRLIVPLPAAGEVVGFISLGERLSQEAYTRRDGEMLLGVAGQVAMALDYSQLIAQEAEQERLRHEIRLAGEVQTRLLPEAPPEVPGFELEQLILPAREVAGDFFQFYPRGDGDLVLVIGDVSGKGLRAAMLVAHALGAVEAIVQETHDPAMLLRRLNQLLYPHLKGSGMITCVGVHLHPATGRILLANAGHPYPYLKVAPGRAWEEVEGPAPRLPLGVRERVEYGSVELEIEPGGGLVLMSDGVVEAQDLAGEMLGYERLLALLAGSPEGRSLPGFLVEQVRRHASGQMQQDDISVVALTRCQEPPGGQGSGR